MAMALLLKAPLLKVVLLKALRFRVHLNAPPCRVLLKALLFRVLSKVPLFKDHHVMAFCVKALLFQVLLLLKALLRFSGQGSLMAWRGQKKWMAGHSGETGQGSGTESQRGTETGIETGIERGTEDSVAVGGLSVATEWMGESGSAAGRRKEANSREADGTEIGTGREIGTGTGTGTTIGRGIEIATETAGTGGRGGAAWIVTGDEGEATTARAIVGAGREETGEGETEGGGRTGKKGTGQGGRSGGKGPLGGTKTTDWLNWKTWTGFGPLTARSNLV